MVVLLAALQPSLHQPTSGIMDMWPVYYGAKAWSATGDAYWNDPAIAGGTLSEIGNAYPLPAALLGLPLSWLPTGAAGVVWVLALGLAWVAAVEWSGESRLWYLWFPMWDALRIQQPSALVTVGVIVAMGALRRDRGWMLALGLALMALKPQQTALLLVVLAWQGRAWWRQLLVVGGTVLTVSVLAQPNWVAQWLDKVSLRSQILTDEVWLAWALVPLGIILLLRGWRPSGLAVLSTAAGPWPLTGSYVASAWPVGWTHDQAVRGSLVGLLALGAVVLAPTYWVFPTVLVVGLLIAAVIPGATAPAGPRS
jgi:hypothetical protein